MFINMRAVMMAVVRAVTPASKAEAGSLRVVMMKVEARVMIMI
jgi:hypothetical protein